MSECSGGCGRALITFLAGCGADGVQKSQVLVRQRNRMPRTKKQLRTRKKPSAHPSRLASAHDLEPGAEDMRRMVEGALDRIVSHIESLPRQKAADVEGAVE